METMVLHRTVFPAARSSSRFRSPFLLEKETKHFIGFPLWKPKKANIHLRADFRRTDVVVGALVSENCGTNETEDSSSRKKRFAVFVSGGGSNFKSLHEAMNQDQIHGNVVVVVTDKATGRDTVCLIHAMRTVVIISLAPAGARELRVHIEIRRWFCVGCGGSEYAKEKDIPVVYYPKSVSLPSGVPSTGLVDTLREFKVDFLLLAGYLKLLPVELVRAFPKAILNIHPSLLPAFGGKGYYGLKVHKAVIASGARYSGPTIHYVDEHYDTGRTLAQRVVPVLMTDTAEELAARVLHEEHQLYVEVATALSEDRIVWREDGVPFIRKRGHQNEYY